MIPRRVVLLGLVALVALALAGCKAKPTPQENVAKSASELRAAVAATVQDSARVYVVNAIADRLRDVVIEQKDARQAYAKRLRELDADYDATEEQFRAVMNDFNAGRETRLDRALALRDSLAQALTAEEWEKLKKARVDFDKAVLSN